MDGPTRAALIIIGAALLALIALAVVCGYPNAGPARPETVTTIAPPAP